MKNNITYKNKEVVNFLFEAATLKRLKRTGWQVLGDNEESIAEHSFMVSVISYVLASEMNVNMEKVLLMSIFHDVEEVRTGDVYKLADSYVTVEKEKAVKDVFANLPNSSTILGLLGEYEERQSMEAKIVKEADILALCLELKQLVEKGNQHAQEWLDINIEHLMLKESKALGEEIRITNSHDWWKKDRERIKKSR